LLNDQGRIFNSQNIDLMRQMAAQGCSAREIAEVIGSTASSVRAKCSHERIRLKRGRGRALSLQAEQIGGQAPLVAYLPGPIYAQLVQKANELQQSPSVLASMLLSAVIVGDHYRALIED